MQPMPTAPVDAPRSAFAADARFERLSPNARRGMRVSALVGSLLVLMVSAVPLFLLSVARGEMAVATWLSLEAALAVLLLSSAWLLAGARWSATGWRLDEDGLAIRRGLLWRSETLVPRSRVQHVDLGHGPIDRLFGLATLKVHTAGTHLSSVTLAGMAQADAEALRDALVLDERGDGGQPARPAVASSAAAPGARHGD